MTSFFNGVRKSIPIVIGYIAASFAFGVFCCTNGVTPLVSILFSITNLTSAGQFAGVKLMLEAASLIEIGVTVLIINLRYFLMSVSLSQRLDSSIPTWKRMLIGYGVTDEAFSVAINETENVTPAFMAGIIIPETIAWLLGTTLGAFASTVLPANILNACGIALYAMFIAIFMPNFVKSTPMKIVIIIALVFSFSFEYVPVVNQCPAGLKIIIGTVVAALIGAIFFPIKED